MKRFSVVVGVMMAGLLVQAAEGKHIARAVLQAKSGATVASSPADMNGRVRFTNVPPGEYRLVLTNLEGRSVTVADLDGDGMTDIVVQGASPSAMGASSGAGAGKASMSDLSVMKVSPRDSASGLPTGKRQHRPIACLVDWDGSVKGGFHSETQAQAEGQRLPANTSGRCAVRVLVEEQPGTIEVLSWSWGASNANHTKTGHVTLMK